jgi:hypothetical protein
MGKAPNWALDYQEKHPAGLSNLPSLSSTLFITVRTDTTLPKW